MSQTTIWPHTPSENQSTSRVIAAIEGCTPKELADGLRIAVKAYRIKADRVKGRDRQWMRDRAVAMAHAMLEISTGGVPL